MKPIRQSARPIECLRVLFPGKWEYVGGKVWQGEEFSVRQKRDEFIRTDTGKRVVFPKRKKRNHFIHNILGKKFGGVWERHLYKHNTSPEWVSPDHEFIVYKSCRWNKGNTQQVYVRSDTKEVVYQCNGRKFYAED